METNKTRAGKMRVVGSGLKVVELRPMAVERPADVGAGEGAAGSTGLSAVLKPAMDALQQAPEVDQARVEALRDALAKGELKFDAKRLAGLIERFHGAHE